MDIKELIERVRLTPEAIRELCIAHFTEKWDRETAEEVVAKVTFEFTTKVADAATNKVLNDPDLFLRVGDKKGCRRYVISLAEALKGCK